MRNALSLAVYLLAGTAIGEEARQLGAHEHGVGLLNIAFDGNNVAMELRAPGTDIVGFEHAAERAEDRAAIEAAVAMLARPLDLFRLPEAAGCTVTQASAKLESEHDHDDHDDHAEAEAHDDHDDHDDEAHADEHRPDEAGHTEFDAEYLLACADPDAISDITFAYFDDFENARELKVQVVTAAGAQAFDVDRDTPILDLRGMF